MAQTQSLQKTLVRSTLSRVLRVGRVGNSYTRSVRNIARTEFSVSLFIDHYIADFGLSRTTVSGLYGLGTFLAALSLTWIGHQIDRRGNRLAGTIIAGLFALALLACSLITGPVTILISFIAIRGLGQGSLGLTSSTAIAEWFNARRGFVMGISLVCFALFQRLYLPWLQSYIDAHGWRQTWLLLGSAVRFGRAAVDLAVDARPAGGFWFAA